MSNTLRDLLLGAIVGGIFTLCGGLAASFFLYRLESRREERREIRDHKAAVLSVLFEMTTALAGLNLVLRQGALLNIPLSDISYRACQLPLFGRLPEDTGKPLAKAYGQLPILSENVRTALARGTLTAGDREVLGALYDDMADAYRRLRDYAVNRLRVKL